MCCWCQEYDSLFEPGPWQVALSWLVVVEHYGLSVAGADNFHLQWK